MLRNIAEMNHDDLSVCNKAHVFVTLVFCKKKKLAIVNQSRKSIASFCICTGKRIWFLDTQLAVASIVA